MNLKRLKINDGIDFSYINTDKSKSDVMFINFIVPLELETATHYNLLSRILNRGTVNFPDMQAISKRLDDLYSAHAGVTVIKKGEAMVISFSLSAIRRAYTFDGEDVFQNTLELLSEMIFKPFLADGLFSTEYFQNEKNLLADIIRSSINNKTNYSIKRCTEIMCKDEVYSVSASGDLKILDSVNIKSLYDCYVNLLEMSKVEILYAGTSPFEDILKQINELIPLKPRIVKLPQTKLIKECQLKTFDEKLDVTQGKLCMGFRTGISLKSIDYVALALFNELYGGGMTSKLFVNVREKQSLCYFCQSVPDPHKGIMYVVSGIDFESYEKARTGILIELDNIKNGSIKQNEFENAKKSLINSYREILDDPSKVCGWYLNRILADRYDSPLDSAAAVEKLCADDIVKIANNIVLDTVYFLRG